MSAAPSATTPDETSPAAHRAVKDAKFTIGYNVVEGIRDLLDREKPDTSLVSIAPTGLSIVIMQWLARIKRKTG